MERIYVLGTRASRLALKQVDEALQKIRDVFPTFKCRVVTIDTYGDKDKATPISSIEGTDFFTREIDRALLDGIIDLAVHSAKDLPDTMPSGLLCAATTAPKEPSDALVSRTGATLDALSIGAKIGTSSTRRKTQLKKYRDDFILVDIRGTIEERLEQLETKGLDAVIIAACALERLELEHRIAQRIPQTVMATHPLQGALAVLIRAGDTELNRIIAHIHGK
ncbi:hydroxymethylbilane synthase [bacterium]|nr:hydroxymethylbilane synthase [bacterium]